MCQSSPHSPFLYKKNYSNNHIVSASLVPMVFTDFLRYSFLSFFPIDLGQMDIQTDWGFSKYVIRVIFFLFTILLELSSVFTVGSRSQTFSSLLFIINFFVVLGVRVYNCTYYSSYIKCFGVFLFSLLTYV